MRADIGKKVPDFTLPTDGGGTVAPGHVDEVLAAAKAL